MRRRISHADLHINLKLLPPTRSVEGGSTHCQISCLLSTGGQQQKNVFRRLGFISAASASETACTFGNKKKSTWPPLHPPGRKGLPDHPEASAFFVSPVQVLAPELARPLQSTFFALQINRSRQKMFEKHLPAASH